MPMWARRNTVCEPYRPLEEQRVKVSTAIQFESTAAVPRWLIWSVCSLARPLIRVGLWLSIITFRCSAGSARFSLARTAVVTGLFGVNACAGGAGTALGWLTKALLLSARLSSLPGRRRNCGLARRGPFDTVTAGPRIYATDLHDGSGY